MLHKPVFALFLHRFQTPCENREGISNQSDLLMRRLSAPRTLVVVAQFKSRQLATAQNAAFGVGHSSSSQVPAQEYMRAAHYLTLSSSDRTNNVLSGD